MIQTNELRIGNWVKVEDACYKVVGVGQIFATLCRDGERKTFVFPSIEPIPLTDKLAAKLLNKNAWDYIGCGIESYNYVYLGKRGLELKRIDGIAWEPTIDMDEDGIGEKIFYLHQLQNLYYALYHEELDVKL